MAQSDLDQAGDGMVTLKHFGVTIKNNNGVWADGTALDPGHIVIFGWLGTEYRVANGGTITVPKRCAIHHVQVHRLHSNPLKLGIV